MTRQQELVPAVCYPSRTCLSQWKAPSEIYPQKIHETGGNGENCSQRTARPHSTFFWDTENKISPDPSLQTARKLKVPEKEIGLMLFKDFWLQTLTQLSEQHVHMLTEQSTCTWDCRNVRYHKVLSRDDNRRILLQIIVFLPNLCCYLLTEIHSSNCKSLISDGLIQVLQ